MNSRNLRERLFAVVLYDHGRVFDNLPRRFDADCEREPPSEGHSWEEIPQTEIEKETVNDVREGIPI
jgi:hypothetical protein